MLTGKKISDTEYDRVLKAWSKFEIKTMKDYHDLYLTCDVFLLADAFEKFRNNSSKNYGLCPRLYLSAPGLRWDEMFKMTKIKLERFIDADMYIFFEKDTRGGISYISNRNSKASNKYWNFITKNKNQNILYS